MSSTRSRSHSIINFIHIDLRNTHVAISPPAASARLRWSVLKRGRSAAAWPPALEGHPSEQRHCTPAAPSHCQRLQSLACKCASLLAYAHVNMNIRIRLPEIVQVGQGSVPGQLSKGQRVQDNARAPHVALEVIALCCITVVLTSTSTRHMSHSSHSSTTGPALPSTSLSPSTTPRTHLAKVTYTNPPPLHAPR